MNAQTTMILACIARAVRRADGRLTRRLAPQIVSHKRPRSRADDGTPSSDSATPLVSPFHMPWRIVRGKRAGLAEPPLIPPRLTASPGRRLADGKPRLAELQNAPSVGASEVAAALRSNAGYSRLIVARKDRRTRSVKQAGSLTNSGRAAMRSECRRLVKTHFVRCAVRALRA